LASKFSFLLSINYLYYNSALGVSAIMRYINRRFTYLLTYLLPVHSIQNFSGDIGQSTQHSPSCVGSVSERLRGERQQRASAA